MTKFRTTVEPTKSNNQISYSSNLFFIGSCFSDNIGTKLKLHKFNVENNPFGVLYNPVSIKNSLEIILQKQKITDNDLIFQNSLWQSFKFHSVFSNPNKEKYLEKINTKITNSYSQLKNTNYLFITFGTSWIYEYNKTHEIVANCHKFPAKEFTRKILTISKIVEQYVELINNIKEINTTINIVFTLSPVRHWKDGAEKNLQSKSILLLAIKELVEKFPFVSYFPSYEIMMDDLRDYRFYKDDMLHPNNTAINYIWDKFKETYLNPSTEYLIKQSLKLNKAMNHRPLNRNSEDYQIFVQKQLNLISKLKTEYPYLNFKQEEQFFNS